MISGELRMLSITSPTQVTLLCLALCGVALPPLDAHRLVADVELKSGGIAAKGYLWKLGHVVDTSKFL